MRDPLVTRMIGAVVLSSLLVVLAVESDQAAHPDRSAEIAVAAFRQSAERGGQAAP